MKQLPIFFPEMPSLSKASILWWLVVMFFCVIVGFSSVILPYILTIGCVFLFVYCFVVWNWPWLGLGFCILLTMFSPDFKMSDVLTVVTFFLFIVKWLNQRSSNSSSILFSSVTLANAYYLFMVLIIAHVIFGVLYFHNAIPFVYRDARVFLYWMWLPIISNFLLSEAQRLSFEKVLDKVAALFLWVGVIVAMMAVFQFITGVQIVAVGRVGSLETAGVDQGSFTRVQLPGYPFVVFSIIYCICSLLKKKMTVKLCGPLIVILCFALVVNFGRGLWVWTIVGVIFSSFFFTGKQMRQFVLWGLFSIIFASSLLAIIKPDLADAIAVRMLSVKNETSSAWGPKTSYEWRLIENQDARNSIVAHPLFGVGMGGEYRRPIWDLLVIFPDHTRYIHNSYFFVLTKFGFTGFFIFMMFIVCSLLVTIFKVCRVINRSALDPASIAIFAVTVSYCGLSVTQPEWVSSNSVLFFSMAYGTMSFIHYAIKSKRLAKSFASEYKCLHI